METKTEGGVGGMAGGGKGEKERRSEKRRVV